MVGRAALAAGLLLVGGALGWGVFDAGRAPQEAAAPTLDPRRLLGAGESAGFARAEAPRPFTFPQDHAAHPDYRHEWWYVTGNVADEAGRRFGYQFTLFRFGLRAQMPDGESAWRTRQLYMGHLAVSDIAAGRFRSAERFTREALGLAGAQAAPLRIWLDDWSLQGDGSGPAWRVRAAEGDIALDLTLTPLKPLVAQGERGLSRKGPEPGNASYYYSQTRLQTRGTLRAAGERIAVSGLSWLDREWGTSALGAGVVGWDWFALQLEDGRELMLYYLRRADGTPDAYSAGMLVDAEGAAAPLALGGDTLTVTRTWTSPHSGAVYPAGWRLRLPAHDLELEVTPLLADQEWNRSVRYWEGAVEVRGRSAGGAVGGVGYVELTGY